MMHPFIDKILIGILKEKPELVQEVHTNGGGKWTKKIENICKYIVENDYKPKNKFCFSNLLDYSIDTNPAYTEEMLCGTT